jgi:hypothetical protein
MTDLTIQSTKITGREKKLSVEIVLSDRVDLENASEKIVVLVKPGKVSDHWHLPAIQRVTLLHARDVLNAEIHRIEQILNHIHD